jgi:F0F1-type ATP synthase delta subunit
MSQKTAKVITENFLGYLKGEGLSDLLPDIAEALGREADRRLVITVMSAAPLSDGEKKELHKTLTEKWGEREVVFTVDDTLLSGMIIAFKDNVIDLSGRQALTDLNQTLS